MKRLAILLAGILIAGCTQQEPAKVASVDAPAKTATEPADASDTVEAAGATDHTEAATADATNAREVLQQALASAQAENKSLFVHFTADW